jgi:hypothetical protein
MSDPFLISLFRHEASCNARLVEALRAVPAEADRRQIVAGAPDMVTTFVADSAG